LESAEAKNEQMRTGIGKAGKPAMLFLPRRSCPGQIHIQA